GGVAILLAIGAGAFALKGRGSPNAVVPPDTARTPVSRDTTTHRADTAKVPGPVVPQPAGTTPANPNPGTPTNPPSGTRPTGTQTHRDTTTPVNGGTTTGNPTGSKPTVDPAELTRQVHALVQDPEFTDVAKRREDGKQLGMKVYAMDDLPSATRADAAFIVSQALIAEASSSTDPAAQASGRKNAGDWLEKAVNLNPKPTWQSLLNTYRNQ
ncbi:MAG: hypothetical protein ABJC74_14500, partial [Gemmatimonadota bacterium]